MSEKQIWSIEAEVAGNREIIKKEIKAEFPLAATRLFMKKLNVQQVANMVRLEVKKPKEKTRIELLDEIWDKALKDNMCKCKNDDEYSTF